MSAMKKTGLLILGVYPESEGYPNVKYRLEDLLSANAFTVSTIHGAIWQHNIPNRTVIALLTKAWAFVSAHAQVFFAYLKHPDKSCVYIPYPAIFIAALLSWLPSRQQPKRLVLDAFISIYDTVVIDRQFIATGHILAKILYSIERRAFKNCTAVIVDTQQNAVYFSELFKLPLQHFVAIPLSTEESGLAIPPYVLAKKKSTITILFVGTLIPLHGIEVILGAIKRLSARKNIVFKVIGSGQMSALITEFIQQNAVSLIWIKEWYSHARILQEIAAADICLGIFGSTAKAQRVCPLKLYAYAACGRAVITADTPCLRSLHAEAAFTLIPAGSSQALVSAIEVLLIHPQLLQTQAKLARDFYRQRLTNQAALKHLISVLRDESLLV